VENRDVPGCTLTGHPEKSNSCEESDSCGEIIGSDRRHNCDRRVVLWIIHDKFMKDDFEGSIASCFTPSKHANGELSIVAARPKVNVVD
jgi:hypothetical protein